MKPLNTQLYNRVKGDAKRKFARFPSLYASSWIVREYKKRGGRYSRNTTYSSKTPKKKKTGISRWYTEKWVDVRAYLTTGKYVSCGSSLKANKACRPIKRVSAQTPITVGELLKLHKPNAKAKLLKLVRQKERDMAGSLSWKTGKFPYPSCARMV